jgi:hypothetical protein
LPSLSAAAKIKEMEFDTLRGNSSQNRLKSALKLVLWNQGRSEAQVASLWGCSEQLARRQLGEEDLPLPRLLALLDWLDMSLSDLQMLAESNRTLDILKGRGHKAALDVTPTSRPALRSKEDDGRIVLRAGELNLLRPGPQPEPPGFFERLFKALGI